MSLIQWDMIIPKQYGATVLFSILRDPPTPRPFDVTVSAIRLPGNFYIDVEWKTSRGVYAVTLFRNTIQTIIRRTPCTTIPEVEKVREAIHGAGVEDD